MARVTELPGSRGRRYAPLAVCLPACWDPAGRRLAVGVREGLAVISVDRPAVRLLGEPGDDARAIAWSPDGSRLALACDGRDLQRVVHVADGAEVWHAALGEPAVDEWAWSPDGRRLALIGDDLLVCAADTGAELWRRRETRVRTFATVVVAGAPQRLRPAEHARFTEERVPTSEAHWSPDGKLLAARWGEVFRVLDAETGAAIAEGSVAGVLRWGDHGQAPFTDDTRRLGVCSSQLSDRRSRTVTFSPDGRFVAAEGDAHCLWIQDEQGVRALPGHPRTITAIAWSTTGALATACRDGVVRRWSPGEAALVRWAELDVQYAGLYWSPDGAYLAACCADSVAILPAI